jgi:hypothetical protein
LEWNGHYGWYWESCERELRSSESNSRCGNAFDLVAMPDLAEQRQGEAGRLVLSVGLDRSISTFDISVTIAHC